LERANDAVHNPNHACVDENPSFVILLQQHPGQVKRPIMNQRQDHLMGIRTPHVSPVRRTVIQRVVQLTAKDNTQQTRLSDASLPDSGQEAN
jgi:hypothetical protein